MRRYLHSLLVGVLTLSLSIDAARACGHLRRWHHATPACEPPVAVEIAGWPWCVEAATEPTFNCDHAWAVGPLVWVEPCSSGEVMPCGAWLSCGDETVVVDTAVADHPGAVEVSESPTATPAPVAATVPDLEPVAPASAAESAVPEAELEMPAPNTPAVEPAPHVTDVSEPPAAIPESLAEEAPAEPRPRNAFEEADEAAADATDSDVPDGATPADQDALPADDAPPDVAPSVDPPAAGAQLPGNPAASAEPFRRWIDDTASSAVVGRLVGMHGDAVEILTSDGCTVDVPLARLSGFDRDYVAARPSRPLARETASR